MRTTMRPVICAAVLLLFAVVSPSLAQEPILPPTMPAPEPAATSLTKPDQQKIIPVEKISAGIFRLGDIIINKETRSLTFPALINMDKGLLEYLLVRSGGKTHESLFRTNVQPYNLQLAFLLLGFEGTSHPLSYQGAPEKPEGEPLEITITYKKETRTKTIRPEEWLIRKEEAKTQNVGQLNWVFTGSMIVDGDFIAQREGSIIAIFHDPVALIDNTSAKGDDDNIWFVKEGSVPPVGTPVTITVKAK